MGKQAFGAWLAKQDKRNDPVGDLARDWVYRCPCDWCQARGHRPSSLKAVREELEHHSACRGAWDSLDRAVEEWNAL